jgi:hypothetical protein
LYCENCGAEVGEGARFCQRCGAPVGEGAGFAERPTERVRTPWSEVTRLWPMISRPAIVAVSLALAALVVGFIGLLLATTADGDDANALQGPIVLLLGTLLAGLAVVVVAAARVPEERAIREDLATAIGGAFALAAVVFALVGLVKSHADEVSAFDAGAWFTFATACAFLALGWLLYSRPLASSLSWTAALGGAVLAAVFGLVGLSLGLGDDFDGYVAGVGWLSFAAVWVLLALAAAFGRAQDVAG